MVRGHFLKVFFYTFSQVLLNISATEKNENASHAENPVISSGSTLGEILGCPGGDAAAAIGEILSSPIKEGLDAQTETSTKEKLWCATETTEKEAESVRRCGRPHSTGTQSGSDVDLQIVRHQQRKKRQSRKCYLHHVIYLV